MNHLPSHRTKIVCTIGPASDSTSTLQEMIRAGLNVARLNLAHGTQSEHRARISRIQEAAQHTGRRVTILADLPGPKIRIGELPAPMQLRTGTTVLLAPDAPGTDNQIPLELPALSRHLQKGDRIYLNDGFLELAFLQQDKHGLHCKVVVGGTLLSHKGVNLPEVSLRGGAFTPADRELLAFALQAGVDGISVSFVDDAEDLHKVRNEATSLGYSPFLIAKIERSRALKHLDEIITAADGIMVARGDLGVEVPIAEIGVLQKRLIRQTRAKGKPVITATQMLESMVRNSRPTRAEVTDVTNAILDGTDAVMLSEESAMGDYPVEAVKTLAEIARIAEENRGELQPLANEFAEPSSVESLIAQNVWLSTEKLGPRFVIIPTETGATAARFARYRSPVWVLALSPHAATCQRLALHYGVYPVEFPHPEDSWTQAVQRWLMAQGIHSGEVILTQGPSKGHPGGTNRMEILSLVNPSKA
ncbi:MAG: pyruvate kinase [Acidithiobacillus sp.]